ncbi:MAG: hypothetical protein K0R90_1004, partial [Oscillospiraceae bacterium]|nr:hypothetical protein [Oscillospiraceae bacterium]
MKKSLILLLTIIITLTFSACKQQPPTYSFGPKEDTSKISQEYKDTLQKYLESAGKAPTGVSFVGYKAQYDEQGKLHVNGFMRNNTGHNI